MVLKVRGVLTVLFAVAVLEAQPARQIALTFDDLPASQAPDDSAHVQRLNASVVGTLQKHRAWAIGFVNEGKLGDDASRAARIESLRIWTRAGLPLGNHTKSHADVNTTPLEAYEREIVDGESVWTRLMTEAGLNGRWFRHPYVHTGPTKRVKDGLNAILEKHRYQTAPFTVEYVDYLFSDRYRRATLAGNRALAKKIGDAYLVHLDTMLDFFERLTRETFGREIPQILLAHVNDINADYLPAVLDRLQARGYGFVTLDAATRDEAYRTPDEYVGESGPSWLHRWRVGKGLPSKLQDEPDPPKMDNGRSALTITACFVHGPIEKDAALRGRFLANHAAGMA